MASDLCHRRGCLRSWLAGSEPSGPLDLPEWRCCCYIVCYCDYGRLRTLNLTKNHLTCLPPLNTNLDLNKVQELYLSGNAFTNTVMNVVSGYSRLKVLHLAQNELTEIFDE